MGKWRGHNSRGAPEPEPIDQKRAGFLAGARRGIALRINPMLQEGPEGISRAAAYAEKEADKFVQKIDNDAIERRLRGEALPFKACRKGCSDCCGHRIIVSPVEAIAIYRHIESTWNPAEKAALKKRAKEYVKTFKSLQGKAPDWTPIMCPLNVAGSCTVYSARPISCRLHHSFDLELCRKGLRGEYDGPMPQYTDLLVLGNAVTAGLEDAQTAIMKEDYRVLLGLAISAFMDNPGLVDKWLAGETQLEIARDDALVRRAQRANMLPTK